MAKANRGRTILAEGLHPLFPGSSSRTAAPSLSAHLCPTFVLNKLSSACSPTCNAVSPKVNSVPPLTGFCLFETFIVSAGHLASRPCPLLVWQQGPLVLIWLPRSSSSQETTTVFSTAHCPLSLRSWSSSSSPRMEKVFLIIFYGRIILPFVPVPHLLCPSSLLLHAACSSDLSILPSAVIHGVQVSSMSAQEWSR